jgi:hypothetical protein
MPKTLCQGLSWVALERSAISPLGRMTLDELPKRVHELGERFLDQRVRLLIGQDKSSAQLRELGMRIDEEAMLRGL